MYVSNHWTFETDLSSHSAAKKRQSWRVQLCPFVTNGLTDSQVTVSSLFDSRVDIARTINNIFTIWQFKALQGTVHSVPHFTLRSLSLLRNEVYNLDFNFENSTDIGTWSCVHYSQLATSL